MFKTNNIQSPSEREEEEVYCSAQSNAYTEKPSSLLVEEETLLPSNNGGRGI
jgi:hypothetical protein